MRAQRSGRSEVHPVGPSRDILGGKQSSAAQLEIWHYSSASCEVPLGTECPPPVQICISWPPSSTRDCAQLNEAHTSRSSPKNFLMKFSTLGNIAVRLATIQQTSRARQIAA